MANLVTLTRLLLLFALVGLATAAPAEWRVVNPPLLLLIIALDGVDGWIARRRGEASAFGSTFDIAVDRAVENVMWLVLAHLGHAPVWIAIVFIVRGVLVDAIRGDAAKAGESAFAMMRTSLGQFLVASRFMRGLYGALKAATFAWLLALDPWKALAPDSYAALSEASSAVSAALIAAAVALCLVRGAPVLLEYAARHRAFGLSPLRGAGG